VENRWSASRFVRRCAHPSAEIILSEARTPGAIQVIELLKILIALQRHVYVLSACHGSTWELKLGRKAVSRWLGVVVPVLLSAGTSTAFAQSPNDLSRMFGVPQRASVQAATRSAWNRISGPEIGCINDALRQYGARIETLIQRGVLPADPRIDSIRSNCQQSRSGSRYVVAGVGLGSRAFDSSEYREYKCSPSDQFDGFTWCQKTRQERGFANVTYSILHSQDGTVVYVNRFQEPAFFGRNEADDAIRQFSRTMGVKAEVKRLPPRRGVPEGILATWGKVVLEPLDNDSISILAEGRSPKKGYLIDFIGNFTRSAKEGLPIYRITGGAGFLWLASFDPIGRGILRIAAVDPSASRPSSVPNEPPRGEVQVAAPQAQPAGIEPASTEIDVAPREAEKAVQDAKADAETARSESEAAKRDAQLARAEVDRLTAETAKLNVALERLDVEKTTAEAKARTMESVAYGGIAISTLLFVIVSPILFINRRRAIPKQEEIRPGTKPLEVTGVSPLIETQRASDGTVYNALKTGETSPVSDDLA
jgi:hypothetical protein